MFRSRRLLDKGPGVIRQGGLEKTSLDKAIKMNARHFLTPYNAQDKDVELPIFTFAKRFEITKPKNH